MPSEAATVSPAGSMRPVTRRVAGSSPRRFISSAKLIDPAMSRSIRGLQDERAATAGALDAALAHQLAERVPDGDQAAAIARRQLALGRHSVTGSPLARVERGAQVAEHLVVQWDRSAFELEPRHAGLVLGSPMISP